MSSCDFIAIAIKNDCEIKEFPNHYVVTRSLDIKVTVTVPKVSVLAKSLINKLKQLLRFDE